LIPLGKLSLVETEKSDRTGACGRAGLREVKVRRMLAPYITLNPPDHRWYNSNGTDASGRAANNAPVVIDPLGVTNGLTASLGTIPRLTLKVAPIVLTPETGAVTTKRDLADSIFRWRDDLLYVLPEDVKNGTPLNGERPAPITNGVGVQQNDGVFSWFLTVAPQVVQGVATGTYNVSIVVCYRRELTTAEQTGTATDPSGGAPAIVYGGGSLKLTNPSAGTTFNVRADDWIMLCNTTGSQAIWYRVVNAGPGGSEQMLSVVGPDWPSGVATTAVIIERVTGVYCSTIQLDNDSIWSR
jgi:hypothetical protein